MTQRAVFTEAYAVIPKGTMMDITSSQLPHWDKTRAWIIARPLTGFAETFSHYIVEVSENGGSTRPDTDPTAQTVLFVVAGEIKVTLSGETHVLPEGGYAYLPAGSKWTLANAKPENARFHWIRKAYEPVEGLPYPEVIITNEQDVAPNVMPDTEGRWATTRFVEPTDLRHDMHVNIVTFEPGGVIPFARNPRHGARALCA